LSFLPISLELPSFLPCLSFVTPRRAFGPLPFPLLSFVSEPVFPWPSSSAGSSSEEEASPERSARVAAAFGLRIAAFSRRRRFRSSSPAVYESKERKSCQHRKALIQTREELEDLIREEWAKDSLTTWSAS
jgi:hypothetical protein